MGRRQPENLLAVFIFHYFLPPPSRRAETIRSARAFKVILLKFLSKGPAVGSYGKQPKPLRVSVSLKLRFGAKLKNPAGQAAELTN